MSNEVLYTSANVPNGITFDELIGRLLSWKTEQWGWTEQDYDKIAEQFAVDVNDLYHLPSGNYRIFNVPTTLLPEDLSGWESNNLYVFTENDNTKILILEAGRYRYRASLTTTGTDPINWSNISDDVSLVLFHIGDTAPDDVNELWVDTSNLQENELSLKYYNSDTSTWVQYAPSTVMLQSVYDVNNIKEDPFTFVLTKISDLIEKELQNFLNHTENNGSLIHLTTAEKNNYNTFLLDKTKLLEMCAADGELYSELTEYVDNYIKRFIDVEDMNNRIEALANTLEAHTITETDDESITPHITQEDVDRWDNYASGDHEHRLDGRVRILGEFIQGTEEYPIFNPDQYDPSDSAERVILIDDLYILATDIPEEELNTTFHNGNVLAITVEGETDNLDLWKIMDNTMFGVPPEDDYEYWKKGIKQIARGLKPGFPGINQHPRDLDGYGITDAIRKDEATVFEDVDTIYYTEYTPDGYDVASISGDLYVGIQKTLNANGGGTENYPMSMPEALLDIVMWNSGAKDTLDKVSYTVEEIKESESDPELSTATTLAGVSLHFTTEDGATFFGTLYSSDETNPNWATDGVGSLVKVDTTTDNEIFNNTYAFNVDINGVITPAELNVWLFWNTTTGLTFKCEYDVFVDSVLSVNKVLNQNMTTASSMVTMLQDKCPPDMEL